VRFMPHIRAGPLRVSKLGSAASVRSSIRGPLCARGGEIDPASGRHNPPSRSLSSAGIRRVAHPVPDATGPEGPDSRLIGTKRWYPGTAGGAGDFSLSALGGALVLVR
jgi:hypothetical protein